MLPILLVAVSYGTIIFLFTAALVNPVAHIDLIYRWGFSVYAFEFLSLHSAMMLGFWSSGGKILSGGNVIKLGLCLFYLAFAIAFGFYTKSYVPVIFFGLSLLGKAPIVAHPSEKIIMTAWGLGLLLATTFLSVFIPFHALIPFPPEVLAQKPVNASGLFAETPQHLLAWGILYFGGLGAVEIIRSRKKMEMRKNA